jgi:predicted DNA-binding protein
MSKKKKKLSSPVPLRLPDDMQAQIRKLSERTSLSDQDIMRMALDRGLGMVEKLFEQVATKAA